MERPFFDSHFYIEKYRSGLFLFGKFKEDVYYRIR